MKQILLLPILAIALFTIISCEKNEDPPDVNILFLHHSTGKVIWRGGEGQLIFRIAGRLGPRFAERAEQRAALPSLLNKYSRQQGIDIRIREVAFPKASPYGWNNYPFDYYNIWVKNAGDETFMEEPTLELLTKDYDLIIFKHCYPVSNIGPDADSADINSDVKTISNYKLQYLALREKLHQFPETKFILFTGAAQVQSKISEDEALRAKEFFKWVVEEWDMQGDNIHLWDLYSLETEGGLYFKEEYARSVSDSHPNRVFAENAVQLLFNRIVDVIETGGIRTSATGK
ncbi:MAG: hypothetical protein AB9888_13645 [Bacteroidales bacterium]